MVRLYCWLSLGMLFGCGVCTARVTVKEHELFYKEEQVDGKTFTYRCEVRQDATGADHKETWKIDGKSVAAPMYEEEILEGEKNERRVQRAQEERFRLQAIESKFKARRALVKKLLSKAVQSIGQDIHLIEQYDLQSYAAFSEATVSAQEYQQIVQILLPRAQALVQALDPDFASLQELSGRFDQLQDRFKIFMRSTLDSAIEKCDDTRFLKELLTLVS